MDRTKELLVKRNKRTRWGKFEGPLSVGSSHCIFQTRRCSSSNISDVAVRVSLLQSRGCCPRTLFFLEPPSPFLFWFVQSSTVASVPEVARGGPAVLSCFQQGWCYMYPGDISPFKPFFSTLSMFFFRFFPFCFWSISISLTAFLESSPASLATFLFT